ncbi:MAG: geranylgeranyl reductase family protein [Propionibacteriaceae bacterium]|jgi:geranylgeranyl reductase family protein|nr:geranylgeranyl reductase family protein [Propionibacteriaceae bacterium]
MPQDADVIVVGAGPAGSATALHLAQAGLEVVLLEKTTFPREKVCGDGLTPRAVRELALLGQTGLPWKRTTGLRIHVGRAEYRMAWPDLAGWPAYGMVVRRAQFDAWLAAAAVRAGARLLTSVNVREPVTRRQRVVGVATKDGREFRAPVVVAADGNSARLAVAMGIHRDPARPLGVAVRAYFTSPRTDDDWLDSWLELWDGTPGRSHLLPGYGWSFPLADGTCNVGLGLPDANRYRDVDLRDLMARWLATLPASWGFTEGNRAGRVMSAALPMGFNRHPAYARGLVLVGDAAGLVNPFNGEGISYALESGRYAAEAIVAAQVKGLASRAAERVLAGYPERLRAQWGGYYAIGNLFGKLIAHPAVMRVAAHYGLPVPVVRMFAHRMIAHLTDTPPRDGYDRVINLLTRIAPKA